MIDTLQIIYEVLAGLAILYLAVRRGPLERKHFGSQINVDNAKAQEIIAGLNEKYIKQIQELTTRLEAVENVKIYQIIVEFQTSVPPEVREVKITPIECSDG